MKAPRMSLWFLLAVTCLAVATAPAADQDNCANLAKQKYDKVTITSAVFMNDPLGFLPPKTPGSLRHSPRTEGCGAVLPRRRIHRAGAKFTHRFRGLAAARGQMEQQILCRWQSGLRRSDQIPGTGRRHRKRVCDGLNRYRPSGSRPQMGDGPP